MKNIKKTNLAQKMLSTLKVKVYKKMHDDRTLLCGEPMQTNKKGDFFVIPAHMADYVKAVFQQYEVTEEFVEEKPDISAK